MRNLTKTLAVVSILAPASAHPLAIGDIQLHSALNQNLNAEIAVILSGERPSDIKVNLAPADKFNEAGVPWSYFLSKIHFETVTRPNGSVVIKLTSNEVLKEPYLDLLVEVSWPKGNLYREFTVLVDPPAVYKQPTVPVLTNRSSYQAEEYPIERARRTSYKKPQQYFANRGEYGPTRKNDTLWKVAERVRRDDDISVEQMMMALYEENPRAFYQKNVNALLAGKTLKVPEKESILKLTRKQAIAEFNQQTKAWSNRFSSTPVEAAPANDKEMDNQLTLNAPTEATISENAVVSPSPGNEISDKAIESGSGKAGAIDANEAIKIKIAALEKQLAAMQQIIALKDEQIAAYKNQAMATAAGQGSADQPEPSTPVNQPPESAQITREQPAKSEPVDQEKPVEPAPAVKEQPVQPPPAPVSVKPVKPAKPVIQPTAQPQIESSTDLVYPIIGGIGASMLSLLGWLWWRKRKIEEETNTESMFAASDLGKSYGSGGFDTDSMINRVDSATSGISALSEFTSTDFDSFDIDQDEIDPISEADVYLAYGRYNQAEELIRHAISDFPERNDCKLKLLEIFQTTSNKKAFEAYAAELAESGKKDDLHFWSKVIEMANEVCPESALFANEPVNFEEEMRASSSEDVATINLDDNEDVFDDIKDEKKQDNTHFKLSKDLNDPVQQTEIDQDSSADFDLTSFSDIDDVDEADRKDNSSIDFDLSSLTSDITAEEEPGHKIDLDKDRVLDFDFNAAEEIQAIDLHGNDLKESGNTHAGAISGHQKVTSHEMDFSADDGLEDFDFSFDDAVDLNNDSNSDDDYQFDIALDQPLGESDSETSISGFSDLTDMDEFETKLDLARAYIDMGDTESAKAIVEEVIDKGTAEQQKHAQLLMADLQ